MNTIPLVSIFTLVVLFIMTGCTRPLQDQTQAVSTEPTPLDNDIQSLESAPADDTGLDSTDSELAQLESDLDA